MKKNIVKSTKALNLSAKARKLLYKGKKHSPEICIIASGIMFGVTIYTSCKATLRIDAIKKDNKKKEKEIEQAAKDVDVLDYTVADMESDKNALLKKEVISIAKECIIPVTSGALTVALALSSHHTLMKRNATLTAACAASEKLFKDYRSRVVERFGEQTDRELRYNIKTEKIKTKDPETGKTITKEVETKSEDNSDPSQFSPYSKFYDASCRGFRKDPESNRIFLISQQAVATQMLKRKGFMFLNDVYEMLGIEKTPIGQVVGWIFNEECPNGDNYVDFGLTRDYVATRRFVNGLEYNVLLDFNVDGVIVDKI